MQRSESTRRGDRAIAADQLQFATGDRREDATEALAAASSAGEPGKISFGRKLAVAGAVYRLLRRHPVPTLFLGGIALAWYLGGRRARPRYSP